MSHPITASKIVLVADRTRKPAASAATIRRYRLARLSADHRPGARAARGSLRSA
jgi:hypothetical protein